MFIVVSGIFSGLDQD